VSIGLHSLTILHLTRCRSFQRWSFR